MKKAPPTPNRARWLIAFGILTVCVGIYAVVCFVLEHTIHTGATNLNHVAQLRPFMIGTALICLIASVAWLRFRVDGKIGEDGRELILSPSQFSTDSIISLSLSNSCAIFGLELFFVGAPLREFVFFALGTLFVDFAFVLPRGLQFWAAYDGGSNSNL